MAINMNLFKYHQLLPQFRQLLAARYVTDAATKTKIEAYIKNSPVVVFIKGVPDAPKCGFSNAVVQILRMHDVKYDSYNVLENEDLRQGKIILTLLAPESLPTHTVKKDAVVSYSSTLG